MPKIPSDKDLFYGGFHLKDRKKWMPPLIGILVISILGLEILFITKDFFPTKITACTDPQETYETYDVFSAEGPMTRFRNRVDGYSIAVTRGMKADMSRGDLCAVLTDETTRMEIYRQPTPTPKEQESYIYYSNGFMDNKIDHKVSVNELREFGKNNALVTAWERKPVSAIPKDYNHYLSFDILMEENTFSVLIKSFSVIREIIFDVVERVIPNSRSISRWKISLFEFSYK